MNEALTTPKHVLFADDDEAIQACMEDIAEQEGWNLQYATDGVQCLAKIRERIPSLVILDQRMPKMTGEQVLMALEVEKVKVPVILISAEKNLSSFRNYPNVTKVLN